MEIKLPYKALSYNKYYKFWRGRLVISPEGRSFKEEIAKALIGVQLIKGKVSLDITFNFKDNHVRDLDNLLKCLLDSLKNIMFEDDSKIFEIHMKKVVTDEESIIIKCNNC